MTHATPLDVIEGRARWCVVERDALAVLAELPGEHLDAVITDPPYSSGGMFRGDRAQNAKTKYVQSGTETGSVECPDFVGDNRDQRSFVYWCALWMGEAMRASRPGGVLACFIDWRQLPAMSDAIQAGGWIWRGIVPWVKPQGRPTQGRFTSQCEYVVWGTNGSRSLDELDGKALPGFYQANPPRDRAHVTEKPLEVMRPLVRIAPAGGLVLDPFGGSGTTGVAALLEGRRAIVCELVPEYAEIARQRLAAAETGHDWKNPTQGGLFGAEGAA